MMKLNFVTWGERWFEAMPLGNGHLGAMVYGNPYKERIDLSENTFFSGDNQEDCNRKGAKDAFYQMRQSLLEENHSDAYDMAANFIGIRGNYGTNIPVGNLNIDFGLDQEVISNYNRSLNLTHGIIETAYELKNRNCKVRSECFVSHPDLMLVYRIKASDRVLNPIISVETYSNVGSMDCTDHSLLFYTSAREEMHSDGKTGTSLMGLVMADSDGSVTYQKGSICIIGASYIDIIVKVITDFENPVYHQQCSEFANSTSTLFPLNLEECKERHIKDIESYMLRSELKLMGDNQKELDNIMIMYQYGRYLLLSSSREDSKLPAHLQGIWNDNVACRIGWTCDMHLDINTQMNYWPADVTNLSELNQPLFQWIKNKLMPSGKKAARNNYGLEGWIAEIVSNSWGFTSPYWAEPIAPCPTGGVWILTHLWEYYQFTQDIEFLRDNYHVIYQAVEFFADYVFIDPQTGYYVSGPSISPENSFLGKDGRKYQMDIGCTYEIVLIRELFSIFLKVAEILQLEDPLTGKISEILQRLIPYPILKDGSIGEWREERIEIDPQHRHTSHLLGLFPFWQITPEDTPELAEAAQKTIDKKLMDEEQFEATGWATNMLILYAARLCDGNTAYYHIQKLMKDLLEENYLVYHPPTRGAMSFDNVYELDGNTGLTSAIAEMLLQSNKGLIHILPALPSQWKNGYIKGLKARGNIIVDIGWSEGKADFVKLYSQENTICEVRYNNSVMLCNIKEKEVKTIKY